MPARPSISIVLPVFDAAATLPRALDSIHAQTLTDWELIAVDDGSTDASPRLLDRARALDPRIRVVSLPHAGIAPALNAGIAAAQAEFVARMDADDECLPTRLERLAATLQSDPELGLVASLVEYAGDRESHAGYAAHVDWINSVCTPEDIRLQRFVESPFAHPSVAFRRATVSRLGGYRDGPFPEDYELWLRWMEAGVPMTKLPEVLLRWTDHSQRLSRADPRYSADAFYRLKAVYLARWLHHHLNPGRSLLVWGAGRLTRRRVDFLATQGFPPTAFIDIDPDKQGLPRHGREVWAPDRLATLPPDERPFVLGYVANRGAREQQREFLTRLGWKEGTDFLFAA